MANKKPITDEFKKTLEETYKAFCENAGSSTKTAEALGIPRTTINDRLKRFTQLTGIDCRKAIAEGHVEGAKAIKLPLPPAGKIKRYLITTAQNNTHIHSDFWENLVVFAEHIKAEILVSRITYNKAAYVHKQAKINRGPRKKDEDLWYAQEIRKYVMDDRLQVAPTLVICGEVSILPTAVQPLSGFETYPDGNKSAIFPHTTFAMQSTPVMRGQDPKLNYTTGAVTLKNYIQKKEGFKGEFHHSFGALLIEVNHKGDWWVRQINATDDGDFYDLDVRVKDGEVSEGNRVEAISWGDIHWEEIEPEISQLNWNEGGILDTLKPKYQMMHDTLDFYARNHHRRHDPHAMFKRHVEKRASVKEEMMQVKDFLNEVSHRPWCTTIVVDSNHDQALTRWLREADYKTDPENAEFFLTCQVAQYEALRKRNPNFHSVENALKSLGLKSDIKFLRADESFLICKSIECGMHGHHGPNGTRGDPRSLSKVGKRANIGHYHSAAIIHGLYVAGTCSKLDLEYTQGPGSWSWSHILTYANGKRCILTVRNGRWRA